MPKYVIVDIHPEDSFGDMAEQFVGVTVKEFSGGNNTWYPGYCYGTAIFEKPLTLHFEDETITIVEEFFFAVQLQTVEDNTKENDKVVVFP